MLTLLLVWFMIIGSFVAGAAFGRYSAERGLIDILNLYHPDWWPQILKQRYGVCPKNSLE